MKFRHILFPVDFSTHSVRLTRQVEFLARTFGSKVTLLHIFEVPATWYGGLDGVFLGAEPLATLHSQALDRLKRFPINLPLGSVERVLAQGDAGGEIASYANRNDVDLIVMGTHGCGRVRGLLLGSVAAKVMHDALCPVWTESCAQPKPVQIDPLEYAVSHLVCAIELAPEGEQLLRYAAELSELLQVPVTVVHCIPTGHMWPGRYMNHQMYEYLADTALDEIAALQHRAGTAFKVVLGDRGIGRSVAETIDHLQAHLVLIGRGKAQETFGRIRTHGFEILRDAPCPVLSCILTEQTQVPREEIAAQPFEKIAANG